MAATIGEDGIVRVPPSNNKTIPISQPLPLAQSRREADAALAGGKTSTIAPLADVATTRRQQRERRHRGSNRASPMVIAAEKKKVDDADLNDDEEDDDDIHNRKGKNKRQERETKEVTTTAMTAEASEESAASKTDVAENVSEERKKRLTNEREERARDDERDEQEKQDKNEARKRVCQEVIDSMTDTCKRWEKLSFLLFGMTSAAMDAESVEFQKTMACSTTISKKLEGQMTGYLDMLRDAGFDESKDGKFVAGNIHRLMKKK